MNSTTTENNDPPQRFGSTLLISRHGRKRSILLVAFNRPHVKNAFNDQQYLDLVSILQQVTNDPSLHAIVLTGMGEYFSSGADLKETNFDVDENDDDDEKKNRKRTGTIDRPAGKFMITLLSFPKLICCAVNGPAVGIGVTLLPHCDLVFCTENATFWTPFTRISLVPEFASSVTFVETMGLACANQMLILGEKIDAMKAVQNGLCLKIIQTCCCSTTDAFTSNSIGTKVCHEIDDKLFSLPNGDNTSRIFVEMIRGRQSRREFLTAVCKEELQRLDERIESGEVLEAVIELSFTRSKL